MNYSGVKVIKILQENFKNIKYFIKFLKSFNYDITDV